LLASYCSFDGYGCLCMRQHRRSTSME
jgi:hypothetical protein